MSALKHVLTESDVTKLSHIAMQNDSETLSDKSNW